MFCGLADVVRYMVIYRQRENHRPRQSEPLDLVRMSCGWCPQDGARTDGTQKGDDAEMIPKSQQRAVAKYNKEHYRQVIVKMNKSSDSDLLDFLDSLPSGEKAGFIKRAIRNYIKTLSL